jgi:hypothetical protein
MKALAIGTHIVLKSGGKAWEYGPVAADGLAPAFAHANLGRQVRLSAWQFGVVSGSEGPDDRPSAYYVRLDVSGKPTPEVKLFPRQVSKA